MQIYEIEMLLEFIFTAVLSDSEHRDAAQNAFM